MEIYEPKSYIKDGIMVSEIDRLWKGLASIRNYTVDECIAKNIGLKIIVLESGKIMTIAPDKVKNYFRTSEREFDSKINFGQKYKLDDYHFKSDEDKKLESKPIGKIIKKSVQTTLFDM